MTARSRGRRRDRRIALIVAERRATRERKGRDRLRAVPPSFDRIVERWASRAPRLVASQAIKLLDRRR